MSWRPDIETREGFIHQRILNALESDIAAGVLAPETRLPTHRRLAFDLGVGVGAVTKAYAEAEARGLLVAQVGRGSFVAPPAGARAGQTSQPGLVDLARNTAPSLAAGTRLATALTQLRRRGDLGAHLDYPPPAGMESHRQAAARWLSETLAWPDVRADGVLCTGGAQQAAAVALGAACRPGAAVIVEAATFSGIKTLASHMDYRLEPAAMDHLGLTPETLERAARASGARVAYVQPLQTPTGRIMGLERRQAIVGIARAMDLLIVEDDLYGAYAGELGLPPLAALAPERVFHVSSLSKSVTPGLRVGYLVPPKGGDWMDRCMTGLRALAFGPPGLAGLLAAQWISDGTAAGILAGHKRELAARTDLALEMLPTAERPAVRAATHLWLPMSELHAERSAARALLGGVQVTAPSAPQIPGSREHGLRVCLGAAPSREVLAGALGVLVRAMAVGDDRGLGEV